MANLTKLLNDNLNSMEASDNSESVNAVIKENKDLTLSALTAILEMVESSALTNDEVKMLASTVEYTFTNLLESEDEDEETIYSCEECEWTGVESDLDEEGNCPECGGSVSEISYDESEFECEECEWAGVESDLDEEGNCPECGGSVSEISYDDEESEEDDEIYESNMLNKTPSDVKRAAKAYAKSAKGKKSVKNANKKRAKFAAKISACAEKGKTFSFKEMTCVKPKKRR